MHWLHRISDRVQLEPNRVFPTDKLLDHVPLLIEGIADYLEEPAAEVGVDMPVVGKAMELGALRHSQGFDAYEILKEYEILGGILYTYLAQEVDRMPEACAKSELLACGHRLFRAISLIQEATTTHFLRLAASQINEREDRLRAFNRAISHEIKNRIGAILGASDMMHDYPNLSFEERQKFVEIVQRNARAMQSAVANVLAIGRSADDVRKQRNVPLASAVKEAMRQVREATQAVGISMEVGELPNLEVNAAAVELCLTNYLSNALKYADPSTTGSWIRIEATREQSAHRRLGTGGARARQWTRRPVRQARPPVRTLLPCARDGDGSGRNRPRAQHRARNGGVTRRPRMGRVPGEGRRVRIRASGPPLRGGRSAQRLEVAREQVVQFVSQLGCAERAATTCGGHDTIDHRDDHCRAGRASLGAHVRIARRENVIHEHQHRAHGARGTIEHARRPHDRQQIAVPLEIVERGKNPGDDLRRGTVRQSMDSSRMMASRWR